MTERRSQKRSVRVVIGAPYTSGRLEDLEQAIKEAWARVESEGLRNARYEIEYQRGYCDSIEVTFQIEAWRDETREEASLRQQQELQRHQEDIEWKRRQLEQLRRELGEL